MNKYTDKEFSKKYKINSIRFLELEKYNDVLQNINSNLGNFCTSCFDGKYLKKYDF